MWTVLIMAIVTYWFGEAVQQSVTHKFPLDSTLITSALHNNDFLTFISRLKLTHPFLKNWAYRRRREIQCLTPAYTQFHFRRRWFTKHLVCLWNMRALKRSKSLLPLKTRERIRRDGADLGTLRMCINFKHLVSKRIQWNEHTTLCKCATITQMNSAETVLLRVRGSFSGFERNAISRNYFINSTLLQGKPLRVESFESEWNVILLKASTFCYSKGETITALGPTNLKWA